MVIKYLENDYLNSIKVMKEISELDNRVKNNLAELLFFCIGKNISFVVSILNLELAKYINSKLLVQALIRKIIEGK